MVAVFVLAGLAAVALLGGVHWYVWRRLVRDVSAPHSLWRRVGTVLAVALPLVSVANMVAARAGAPFAVERVLAWPGYMWLALLLYLVLALLAGEVVRLAVRRVAAARRRGPLPAGDQGTVRLPDRKDSAGTAGGTGNAGSAGSEESRRVFLARSLAVGAGAASVATVGAGAYSVLNGPTLKRLTLPLPKLGRAAHGYRIAVVSDIHLGPTLGRAHTRRIVNTINGTQPDLVAIVGDLVDGSVADLGPAAEPLRHLRSRHGSFFVTGNHEYIGDAGEWIDHLRELGVHPLENARRELPGFDLAGVNDLAGEDEGQGPDFRKALGDRDPARAAVLLAHQPVQIHEAVDWNVGLQLSGHTHGGQMWPMNLLAGLANPTVAGLERYGDTQLYVTRGAGAWGPPVRVGAESDITLVKLESPAV
ncbi:metallophosphoesterase [Streptomyces boncukensis]|uniref:Metallophosphoesterase n=1 Tax=Streptomyces boncukensis TaxID=2711219 RepID=A0A6G4WVX1_9ACTN|nr:metallophosphoesterase [Streptomyces boncukensis]NGO69258.1 metallophosphoesterase [Streptomyces boncukensis]